MEKVTGRTDDMIIIKGVNVFPSQVEQVLNQFEGIKPHYQIVLGRDGALDTMDILMEVNENLFFDEMKKQRELVDSVKEALRSALGLGVGVKLIEPKTLERFQGKATRVVDNREI